MYYDLYTMLQEYIYGAAELTNWQDLTLTMLSTMGVLFIVGVPFFIIYWFFKLVRV